MFLVGDFNAYSEEDPVQELEKGVDNTAGTADDYTALEDDIDDTESYSFSGLSGSLDHVFANDAAVGRRDRTPTLWTSTPASRCSTSTAASTTT